MMVYLTESVYYRKNNYYRIFSLLRSWNYSTSITGITGTTGSTAATGATGDTAVLNFSTGNRSLVQEGRIRGGIPNRKCLLQKEHLLQVLQLVQGPQEIQLY